MAGHAPVPVYMTTYPSLIVPRHALAPKGVFYVPNGKGIDG